MKIFYQGVPGAYSHIAAEKAAKNLNKPVDEII
jgi:hypothetical protein